MSINNIQHRYKQFILGAGMFIPFWYFTVFSIFSVPNSIQVLVGLLTGSCPNLQLQAAWCLTNMAAGTETQSAIALKFAGPYLITYLNSGNAPLQVCNNIIII